MEPNERCEDESLEFDGGDGMEEEALEGAFEDDAFEDDEESEDLVCDDPPTWQLAPNQRITVKTVAGAIGFLTLFMAVLFWVNGPKAYDRTSGDDLARDGLKGPVKSVEYRLTSRDLDFNQMAVNPRHFVFRYDRDGNRTEEEYYDEEGAVSKRVVFTHDTLGNLVNAVVYGPKGETSSGTTDKQFGLFDAMNYRLLKNNPSVSQVNPKVSYDFNRNWTSRAYQARRTSKAYEYDILGEETRRIRYYAPDSSSDSASKVRPPRKSDIPFPIHASGEETGDSTKATDAR